MTASYRVFTQEQEYFVQRTGGKVIYTGQKTISSLEKAASTIMWDVLHRLQPPGSVEPFSVTLVHSEQGSLTPNEELVLGELIHQEYDGIMRRIRLELSGSLRDGGRG